MATEKITPHQQAADLVTEADQITAPMTSDEPRRMLNEEQVLAIVPISRTTLYRMEKANRFPKGTYISPNRRVWYSDEMAAWQRAVDEFNPTRGRGNGRHRGFKGSSRETRATRAQRRARAQDRSKNLIRSTAWLLKDRLTPSRMVLAPRGWR